jgi:hypothetical protein
MAGIFGHPHRSEKRGKKFLVGRAVISVAEAFSFCGGFEATDGRRETPCPHHRLSVLELVMADPVCCREIMDNRNAEHKFGKANRQAQTQRWRVMQMLGNKKGESGENSPTSEQTREIEQKVSCLPWYIFMDN